MTTPHQAACAALARAHGWRKSGYSQGENDCVEITTEVEGWVGIRDSELGDDSPILAITYRAWCALVVAAREGDLDV